MTLVTGLSSVELPPMADCAENTHYNPLALFQMGWIHILLLIPRQRQRQIYKDTKTQKRRQVNVGVAVTIDIAPTSQLPQDTLFQP